MFDIGWTELLAIGLVALIVIGPKELPTVLRTVGQWMGKVKRMASEFQGQFQEALREAEVADLKEQAQDLSNSLKSVTEYDPLADIDNDGDKDKDDTSDWDEPSFETSEHEAAAESAAEPEPLPATPVAAIEAAPAVEPEAAAKTDTATETKTVAKSDTKADTKTEELTSAETPPPKQAGGTA